MTTADFATYIAGLPKILAGAAALLRDEAGRVLLVEPNYREGWALPGGTIESDTGETPREGARRETLEETALDITPGALLAVDWVPLRPDRPPLAAYLYDGGIHPEATFASIVLQSEELDSWKLVPEAELDTYLLPSLARRVRAALTVLREGGGAVELVDGHRTG
ncbi:NUDIX domain-containing protein [Streptomyces indicus]|uniref:NUDIX domain-containing protein n=1 Tax=Streptomyces indicus TaxID=417292 RepID=A0A1G8UM14_9ACTN|nr:NUDIX hydrolase [Streptomyces indicus]SDJ54852.1 NUDIX domain-containing protein [Streptomyces indicus]